MYDTTTELQLLLLYLNAKFVTVRENHRESNQSLRSRLVTFDIEYNKSKETRNRTIFTQLTTIQSV